MTRMMARLRTVAASAFALALAACGASNGTSNSTPAATSGTPGSVSQTAPTDPLAFSASNYSAAQGASSVTLTVVRTGSPAEPASVSYATADGTAVAGRDYTAVRGDLQWTANDSTSKTISVPVSGAAAFSGNKAFDVLLTNPSPGALIGNPGSTTVTISGTASASVGTLQLADATYSVAQSARSVTISVNRMGGAVGPTQVAYATTNGTASAGKDYTAVNGVLQWADGDSAAKSFSVAISNATPFSGSRTFGVVLSNAIAGALIGTPDSATVTISGDAAAPVGSLQLSASSYTVSQSAGLLTVIVNRTGGSNGAASVSYSTTSGTAVAGTDFTAAGGTLNWVDGDAASKSFSVAISNAAPFSGSKTFSIALSTPSAGATISNPGSATVTISGSSSSAGTSTSPFWVYYDGTFNWGGDYSFAATANYQDTAGGPLTGNYDIAVTVTSAYGGFLPFAGRTVPLWNFVDNAYSYLTFAIKPSVANQTLQVYFVKVGDVPVGIDVNPFNGQYGPPPQVGVWTTYKIPLSDLGVPNTSVYKFAIQDMTGLSHNVFYLDNIGFLPPGS